MPRKLSFDQEIAIEIVMNEIWLNGYEASSVKYLSEKLGITRSSFYNTFGSRENLLEQALAKYSCAAPTAKLQELTQQTPLKPALTSILRAVCEARSKDKERRGCMVSNCIAELLPSNKEAGNVVKKMAINGLKRYEELVQWAVDRGELPKSTDVKGLALSVHGLMIGINTQSKVIHDKKDLWNSASTTLKALGLYEE